MVTCGYLPYAIANRVCRRGNGIYGLGATATPKDATALAVDLAASGVSWCARLRPSVPDEVDEALGDMGLFAEDEALLMATSLTPWTSRVMNHGDLL